MAPAEYNAIKKNFIQIAGVDPEFTNPLLLNKLYFESLSLSSPEVDYYNPFDIINLQFATVKADDNLLPSLYLKDDLAYVLKKREKYIVPLQQLDHKVCLAIKGAGEGAELELTSLAAFSVFGFFSFGVLGFRSRFLGSFFAFSSAFAATAS